eukprot:CAMPEP_0198308648 /NCGR_PEP_ID=MMETSP1450-20131203/1252_1 /TAXON_ID=753684 ORGANISM="Madagascaria erythrocladiodes, Strain CCMP3234" /NCGR_SAMPLE_ID=MMETSP1450 /ASSEMBLY_ACC=CAM_ASM_001115 /LENGTH=93 /DNA_ID=CAMNT_0044011341 /DNA_START=91 /DNA_END=373 /DNA_ORIENTATION=+
MDTNKDAVAKPEEEFDSQRSMRSFSTSRKEMQPPSSLAIPSTRVRTDDAKLNTEAAEDLRKLEEATKERGGGAACPHPHKDRRNPTLKNENKE